MILYYFEGIQGRILMSIILFVTIIRSNGQNACNGTLFPIKEGYSVTTHGSGGYNNKVITLFDNNVYSKETKPALGYNWNADCYRDATNKWTKDYLGEVFGLCFDHLGNIYVAATPIYGGVKSPKPDLFKEIKTDGIYTGGEIYKIDHSTGKISVFAQLPNSLKGLGNLTFDITNHQFFVSNFQDGCIYRISETGIILNKLNIFNLSGDPKICPITSVGSNGSDPDCDNPTKNVIWGLNVFQDELYFSTWTNDYSISNVKSVKIGKDSNFNLSVGIKLLEGVSGSFPITDITFTDNGKMFLGERTMHGLTITGSHQSIIKYLEYDNVAKKWSSVSKNFPIGDIKDGKNTAGGLAYSYTDNLLWSTGDALQYRRQGFMTNPAKISVPECKEANYKLDYYVYGLVGMSSEGVLGNYIKEECGNEGYFVSNRIASSYYIDIDNVNEQLNDMTIQLIPKSYQGDVEIFSGCRLLSEYIPCKRGDSYEFQSKVKTKESQEVSLVNWYLNETLVSTEKYLSTFTYSGANKTFSLRLEIETNDDCKSNLSFSVNTNDISTPCTPVKPTICKECIKSFSPLQNEKYVVTGWVKEKVLTPGASSGYENAYINIEFEGDLTYKVEVFAKGPVIEGWQRLEGEFTVPSTGTAIKMQLKNKGTQEAFFDDVRVHPFNSRMKSFVYDPVTQKLVAELDEENYATFYEYDDEGSLIRVKKETERGIMTVKETRLNQSKIIAK